MFRQTLVSFLVLAMTWPAVALSASEKYELQIHGMACSFCAYGLEKKLKKVPGVESVHIDINAGIVRLTADDHTEIDKKSLRKIVKNAGFTLVSIRRVGHLDNGTERGDARQH